MKPAPDDAYRNHVAIRPDESERVFCQECHMHLKTEFDFETICTGRPKRMRYKEIHTLTTVMRVPTGLE